ncbi:MAG: dTMP kinase [Asticcacaulis sp.]
MRGQFITFEGGEGAGKSTQVKALVARLRDQGLEVVQTREPGGSGGAEALRELLVTGDAGRWSPISETLMMYAARASHLEQTIRPALERGAWVVCDRFSDSTRAYQGAGGGVSPAFIDQIDQVVVGKDQPDMTLILDMPVEAGLKRALSRGDNENRFESKGIEFHNKLRQGFIDRAATDTLRYHIVDADQTIPELADNIWRLISGRWPALKGA